MPAFVLRAAEAIKKPPLGVAFACQELMGLDQVITVG